MLAENRLNKRSIRKDKAPFLMTKGLIHQEDINIIKFYTPDNRA